MISGKHYYSINSPELRYLRECDEQLDFAIRLIGDLEYQVHEDPFKHFMDTIIGQMLSNRVADVISERFYNLCNNDITPAIVCNLTIDDLRSIGISRDKSSYILSFAEFIKVNPDYFDCISELPDDELLTELQSHKGIGGWSSKMYAIFVLDRQDILPFEDGAFLQSIQWLYGINEKNRNHPQVKKICAKWSPYTSLAARYMYRILDAGYVKQDIEEVKAEMNYNK